MDPKPPAAASVYDHIAVHAGAAQALLQRIRAVVREEASDAQEAIGYRMPAFMQRGAQFNFAALKRHVGVYPPVSADATLHDEARAQWLRAAELTRNARERELLLERTHNSLPEGGKS